MYISHSQCVRILKKVLFGAFIFVVPIDIYGIKVLISEAIPTISALDFRIFQALNRGENIDRRYEGGKCLLHIAAEHGRLDLIRLLLRPDTDVRLISMGPIEDQGENSISFKVSCLGDEQIRSWYRLINTKDKDHCTPLQLAAYGGHYDIVVFLVEEDAKINTVSVDGSSPLKDALRQGHDAIASFLLDHGASRAVLPWLFYKAIEEGDPRAVSFLIEQLRGNDDFEDLLENRDRDGYTPLLRAIKHGYNEIVSMLIYAGVDVRKSCNLDGYGLFAANPVTPFGLAVELENWDVVQELCARGAHKYLTLAKDIDYFERFVRMCGFFNMRSLRERENTGKFCRVTKNLNR